MYRATIFYLAFAAFLAMIGLAISRGRSRTGRDLSELFFWPMAPLFLPIIAFNWLYDRIPPSRRQPRSFYVLFISGVLVLLWLLFTH